jgi:hypothetical protein
MWIQQELRYPALMALPNTLDAVTNTAFLKAIDHAMKAAYSLPEVSVLFLCRALREALAIATGERFTLMKGLKLALDRQCLSQSTYLVVIDIFMTYPFLKKARLLSTLADHQYRALAATILECVKEVLDAAKHRS